MHPSDLVSALSAALLSQDHRVLRMRLFNRHGQQVHHDVIPQRLEGGEALFDGIDYTLVCLAPSMNLPLKDFHGAPVEVSIQTDEGAPRLVCGLVTRVAQGQSDGALTVLMLRIQDAFSQLAKRRIFRTFRNKSAVDAVLTILDEVRQGDPVLAGSFDVETRLCRTYPEREMFLPHDMTDHAFCEKRLRQEGIGWYIEPVVPSDDNAMPRHRLVLFDHNEALQDNPAGTVEYKRASGTETHGTIQHFGGIRELASGRIGSYSWDYKQARGAAVDTGSTIDQGENANTLAATLEQYRIDPPHLGDNAEHYQRLGDVRLDAVEAPSKLFRGAGVQAHFRAGTAFTLSGHPEIDTHPAEERVFILTRLELAVENNLPKELHERVTGLLRDEGFDRANLLPPPAGGTAAPRYANRFTCVRRQVRLAPRYDPADYPVPAPLLALVVGPADEEVHTNEYGCIKVKPYGMRPQDHAHAHGAGASDSERDSAWVSVMTPWAHGRYGHLSLPRVGSTVLLIFVGNDADRPVALGSFYTGTNLPAAFTHVGALPGNRYVSGIKSEEVHGERFNQLRLDDTPGQISAQLASEHAHTQLNLGFMTHPRQDGKGEPRGEGGEWRSDGPIAVRTAQLLLLTTQAMLRAGGKQLERAPLQALLEESKGLLEALGQYAEQHQALGVDLEALQKINDDIRNAEQGSNTQPGTQGQAAPLIASYAEGGFASATPYSTVHYSGRHHNLIAQQHVQVTAGQRFNLNAGQGISLFAHKSGIRQIAHYGKFQMQAQHDDIEMAAGVNVVISASDGIIRLISKNGFEFIGGDTWLKMGNGRIEAGCTGAFAVKAADHVWEGPASMTAQLPQFSSGPTDQRFQLFYDLHGDQQQIAANRMHRITLDDGQVVEGKSDGQGFTSLLQKDAMRIARIEIFKDL